ncbi:hypothetical protein, partial [Rothia dentocariosa]
FRVGGIECFLKILQPPRAIYREKANLCALGLPPFTSINIKYDAAFLKYEGYILHFMERCR